jgi:hypothetical protein
LLSLADWAAREVGDIASGTAFTALTGETHTTGGVFQFTKLADGFGTGHRLAVYGSVDDGFCCAWVNGVARDVEIRAASAGSVTRWAAGVREYEPVDEWRVRARLRNGVERVDRDAGRAGRRRPRHLRLAAAVVREFRLDCSASPRSVATASTPCPPCTLCTASVLNSAV